MDISQIKVDSKAQEEGEWRDHPYFPGVRVNVRSAHSKAFKKRRAQLQNGIPRRQRGTGDAILVQEEIDQQAQCVLVLGFDGITENGEKVEYSPELVTRWSNDPDYRRFFDGVRELSEEIGIAEQSAVEESLGNSRPGSEKASNSRRSTSATASS
jgi:hypothetical protein